MVAALDVDLAVARQTVFAQDRAEPAHLPPDPARAAFLACRERGVERAPLGDPLTEPEGSLGVVRPDADVEQDDTPGRDLGREARAPRRDEVGIRVDCDYS